MNNIKLGNPAVVGLSGFGLTTLLLQFANLGWMGLGPILACGFIFGGLAQLIAGFMEQKTGNNFGFAAFSSYGAFWIAFGIIKMFNNYGVFTSSTTDVGFFLIAWTLISIIFMIGSFFIHTAMATTFVSLVLGFILLDIEHFVTAPEMVTFFKTSAAVVLIFCALNAWYMMAAIVINEVAGREVLPSGKAWIKK